MSNDELTSSVPGWRTRALAAVSIPPKVTSTPHWLTLRAEPGIRVLTKRAAAARGISIVGYARRAIAKQIAADLDIPLTDVLALLPAPQPYAGSAKREKRSGKKYDDGTGYGDWS